MKYYRFRQKDEIKKEYSKEKKELMILKNSRKLGKKS